MGVFCNLVRERRAIDRCARYSSWEHRQKVCSTSMQASSSGELSFGEIVEKQWEEKKKEMESKKQQEAR